MKTRHFLTFALATALAYVLGPGCTQDFDAFEACSFGQKVCDDACVPVDDPTVGCAADGCTPCSFANAGAACEAGDCVLGTCEDPFRNCDQDPDTGCETNLLTDIANCGGCGTKCDTFAHALPACENGDCTLGACDPGWDDCDGDPANGCEANLQNDGLNCGDCGTVCPDPLSCQAGKCTLVCDPGTGDCNNDPTDGCETPIGTIEDCGGCNMPCDLANATPACNAGACQIDTCNAGFDDCDGQDGNGCEADLQDSTATCGACDTPCPEGPNVMTVTCSSGACQLQCDAGFDDCDGDLPNGCEANTAEDDQNCGACGQDCTAIANGAAECNAGKCELTACAAPFADCNGNPADGCETNTDTSTGNCGMCGMGCSFPNAAATCNGGTCQIGACNGAFENCNNNAADGCETNTDTSTGNCGMCNNACPAGANGVPACLVGFCDFTCNAGFGNCDGLLPNGCETNIQTSINNCGQCARACGGQGVASKACSGGVCTSTCDPGFANCNQPAIGNDDGCEQDASGASDNNPDSNSNCGGCGNNCGLQGGINDFECDGGPADLTCGCGALDECRGAGVGVTNAACTNATGQCSCGPTGNLSACAAGESCILSGGQSVCACNGGAACGAGESCCQSPAGCHDLSTDPDNCGACGRACPAGFACVAGACQCDGADDCAAGAPGVSSCNPAGRCICVGVTCGVGERCQPGVGNGQCG